MPDACEPVLINQARTIHALSSVLLIAHAVSHPLDTIELIASCPSSSVVRIVVRNVRSYVDTLDAEQNLNMALAGANIRSQQATLYCSLQPFNVQIDLQRASLVHYC
jgi:deoxycytidylate deaminase